MQIVLPHTTRHYESLVDVLQSWSAIKPDEILYRYLPDDEKNSQTITYGALAVQAKAIAATLQQQGLQPGDRVILIYPPGLELIAAYFGCLYAGIIAVPVYPPLNAYLVEKLQRILINSQSKLLLTTTDIQKKLTQLKLLKKILHVPIIKQIAEHYWTKKIKLTEWDVEQVDWLQTDNIDERQAAQWHPVLIHSDQLAFLQYTSGSTGHPKGVMISHGNLLHNLSILQTVCQAGYQSSGVNWVPPYHDMGLIGAILLPVFVGFPSTLMSPMNFLKQPLKWLQAVKEYRVTICAAPNFAYDYCQKKITEQAKADLDLTTWEVVLNGAEPVRLETLERFYENFKKCGLRKEALFPCYGLAEATLYVSGSGYLKGYQFDYFNAEDLKKHHVMPVLKTHPNAKALVSCGYPELEVCIVNPETQLKCQPEEIGEIWIHGASVAKGYWQLPEETEATFCGHIQGDTTQRAYLRTGDLGFLYKDQLYVAGRIKDLIIIHGVNYYPQDIEYSVSESDSLIRSNHVIAFSVTIEASENLVVVAELKSEQPATEDTYRQLCNTIAQVVAEQHGLAIYAIVFIKHRTLPKTTSGKLRRRYTKEQFEGHQLAIDFQWKSTDIIARTTQQPKTELEVELIEICSELMGRQVDINEQFAQLGVDSLLATQLISRVRDKFDIELSIHRLFECRTIADLAQLIVATQAEDSHE